MSLCAFVSVHGLHMCVLKSLVIQATELLVSLSSMDKSFSFKRNLFVVYVLFCFV